MIAFAYEQCHMLPEAEKPRPARAIRLQRKEPWAHHALAHVLLTQGRNDEARAFLDDVKETWTGLNSFMLTHNWWHLSLVMIEQGEAERVLEHFAGQIWGVWKEYSQDQIGAVSLLARLELAGVDVGDRWQDVADYLAARVDDTCSRSSTMQYLYGLARAGRPEADAMLANVGAFAPNRAGIRARGVAGGCVPAMRGIARPRARRSCRRRRRPCCRCCRGWRRSAAATPSATCSSRSCATRASGRPPPDLGRPTEDGLLMRGNGTSTPHPGRSHKKRRPQQAPHIPHGIWDIPRHGIAAAAGSAGSWACSCSPS